MCNYQSGTCVSAPGRQIKCGRGVANASDVNYPSANRNSVFPLHRVYSRLQFFWHKTSYSHSQKC